MVGLKITKQNQSVDRKDHPSKVTAASGIAARSSAQATADRTEVSLRGPRGGIGGLSRTTLSERTYEALKEKILDQTLAPGARLNIDALSRELNVSSSPIREALVRLEGERLVVSEVYAGCTVAAQPTSKYLHSLLDYRVVIEGHCARLGAPRMDKTTLKLMRQAYEKMVAIPQIGTKYREYRRFVQSDVQFHQAIVDSARNEVMSTAYKSLHAIIIQSRLYRNREAGSARAHEVMEEHHRILEAFERGDGENAANVIRSHLEGGRRRLLNSPIP